MYEELTSRIRYHVQKAEFYGLKEHEATKLLVEAADAIEDLEKQLDEETEYATALACNVPRWIPVTERLPEKYDRVFVYSKATRMGRSIDFINADGNWYTTPKVTHWMPLPEPPKDGEA